MTLTNHRELKDVNHDMNQVIKSVDMLCLTTCERGGNLDDKVSNSVDNDDPSSGMDVGKRLGHTEVCKSTEEMP